MPNKPDPTCEVCRKIVLKGTEGSPVYEGEKLFHLDCYVLYKRPAKQ